VVLTAASIAQVAVEVDDLSGQLYGLPWLYRWWFGGNLVGWRLRGLLSVRQPGPEARQKQEQCTLPHVRDAIAHVGRLPGLGDAYTE
jgi:hypothetical protein